jgi:hypothetical protein
MYLYKYVGPDRIDILKNFKVRFTQPAFLNDPFELSPNLAELITKESITQLLGKVEKIRTTSEEEAFEIYQDISNYQPLLAPFGIDIVNNFPFQKMRDEVNHDTLSTEFMHLTASFINTNSNSFRDELHTKFGVLSLTEKNNNLLMWAHYANSHTGFVIEINGDHSALDLSGKYSGHIGNPQKVKYKTTRPVLKLYDPTVNAKSTVEKIMEEFFLTKSEEWAYEQEWRIILPVDQKIHLMPFPCDCLTGIIFGARMEEKCKQELRELKISNNQLSHIQFRQAIIDPFNFQVNIIDCN